MAKKTTKTAKKPTKKTGRPTPYKEEYSKQVLKLCLLGATDKDIAAFFNVAKSTINKWKREYPEFSDSIKRGKEQADTQVASSLFSRAIGFVKEDCEKVFQYKGEIVRAVVKEYFPPDTTAIIFWLKNRQPQLWRDKQTQVIENPDGTPLFAGIDIKVVKTKKDIENAAE
ncbi:MAG: helix-turn-helix domain-containing protein [Prevotellaceae bacterium]|jgi:hypothetical protein|nr:helix-turn-helix domain-containing protein [Prevotellaceae bacterium]